jgi:trk system potassium uptake protein TrkA
MKILILGAGRVGSSVAESLVSEQNDITVIDIDSQALDALRDRFDLRSVVGNGTHISVLRDAGAEDTDLLIACLTRDESNLVACKIAKQVFNIPTRIARARSSEFLDHPELMGEEGFCVDHLICPERSVTDRIGRLIEFPEALQVIGMADDKVTLVAVRAEPGSPLVSHPIAVLREHIPNVDSRIVAIFRNGKLVMPSGATRIEPGDDVFCMAPTENIRQVLRELHTRDKPNRRIMIAGGGNIGMRLAQELDRGGYQVKLIETNRKRCEQLTSLLSHNTLVLNGDATDEALLDAENVGDMDLFLALTNDDENNIMSSLLAKRMGARRVIAIINRKSYGELMEGGRIDIAIAPAQTTLSELLRHVRRGDVVAVHSLRRGAAEVLEAVAHGDRKSSKVVGRRIEDIDLPRSTTIGAVVRQGQVLIAHHDTVIENGDHVIVFVASRRQIPKVEKLFQVSVAYL